jgi:TolA-binding protein
MISTLSALIREMKEGATEMDQRLEARRAEVEQAVAAADVRLQQIEAALLKSGPVSPTASPGTAVPKTGAKGASRRSASALPKSAAIKGDEEARAAAAPAPSGAPAPTAATDEGPDMDDDERREKYRQALDFARKGWSVAEIARHTRLPRGEIELLLRTKGSGA